MAWFRAQWGRAGLKPPAQYMETLRVDPRIHFSGFSRTEAGIYPAESQSKTNPAVCGNVGKEREVSLI